MSSCAIMQPYFFPYIGYWQLIYAADTFVIYDDVKYFKKGFKNRNYIYSNGERQRLTLELKGASQNKNINEITIGTNKNKLLKQIDYAYKKTDNYHEVIGIVKNCLETSETCLSQYLSRSISSVCDYLGIKTKILKSSMLDNDKSRSGSEKIIEICELVGAERYINPEGGKDLYNREAFQSKNIDLKFLKSNQIPYKQLSTEFIPNLSVLDIMFNASKFDYKNILDNFTLIQ